MATYNAKLECLQLQEIKQISERYLMGFHSLSKDYGFRIAGLNRKRKEHGLPAIDKNISMAYRLDYIRLHYSQDEIAQAITTYMQSHRMSVDRHTGIDVLDCRFGKDYVRAFRRLLGSPLYRKLAEDCRVDKAVDTQTRQYGCVGLAGHATRQKMQQTVRHRYGVENVMFDAAIKQRHEDVNLQKYRGVSPFASDEVRQKAHATKLKRVEDVMRAFKRDGIINDAIFKNSKAELIVFYELIRRFGKADVYYQYGIHPHDARYPFSCDFYIKSLDLFMELNVHYCHGSHWFDETSHEDRLRREHLLASSSRKSRDAAHVWCETDVKKRRMAQASGLNYLVFWDSSRHSEKKEYIPNLRDFYMWFTEYDCNTAAFLADHPENTY